MDISSRTIGALDKIVLFAILDSDKHQHIPATYNEHTDSIDPLSAIKTTPDRSNPTEEFEEFVKHPEIGLKTIERLYFRAQLPPVRQFYDVRREAHVEKYGKKAGRVQDIHYRGYLVDEKIKFDNLNEDVMFIQLDELEEKMRIAKDINAIRMTVNGKDYRINRGVTYALEKFRKTEER